MPITGKTPLRRCGLLLLTSSVTLLITLSGSIWPSNVNSPILLIAPQVIGFITMALVPAATLFLERPLNHHHTAFIIISAYSGLSVAYFIAYEEMFRDRIYGYRMGAALVTANILAMFVPGPPLMRTVVLWPISLPLLSMFAYVAIKMWRYTPLPNLG
jgi:hypothetical protein